MGQQHPQAVTPKRNGKILQVWVKYTRETVKLCIRTKNRGVSARVGFPDPLRKNYFVGVANWKVCYFSVTREEADFPPPRRAAGLEVGFQINGTELFRPFSHKKRVLTNKRNFPGALHKKT